MRHIFRFSCPQAWAHVAKLFPSKSLICLYKTMKNFSPVTVVLGCSKGRSEESLSYFFLGP